VDVGGMVVGRATVQVSVLDGCVGSLHGLLREWDVSARDGVEVRLVGDLGLHDVLTGCLTRLAAEWVEPRSLLHQMLTPQMEPSQLNKFIVSQRAPNVHSYLQVGLITQP
jgi:hypothetical protein